MCALRRNGYSGNDWIATHIAEPAEGRNWQHCKEAIRLHCDRWIDEGLKMERNLAMDKTFEMTKNDSAFLPHACRSVIVGLGWWCAGEMDLDASIVALNKDKVVDFIVRYAKTQGPGVYHQGDD